MELKKLENMPDHNADPRLLPSFMISGDNSMRIRFYKKALRNARQRCLTGVQQEQMRLYYERGLQKSQIAAMQNRTCSAVCKSMKAGEQAIKQYVELYMQIYDSLEREFRESV